jgi:hypothetical protein
MSTIETTLLCKRNGDAPKPAIQRSSSKRVEKLGSELRWRPRSIRVRRNRQVIDQSGLKVLLLLTQLAAAFEGAQLFPERPQRRPRSGQPRSPRVHPRIPQWSDRADHEMKARFFLPGNNSLPRRVALKSVLSSRTFFMPDCKRKSTRELSKTGGIRGIFAPPIAASGKRKTPSAIGKVT